MISIYSHSFVRLCFPLLLKIIHGWSIKVVGWSFYSIIIETYNAHDKLLIREENNVLVELQFSHAHIGKLGKIFGNSFAKSSELIHLKVLAKLEGRKKTAASSLARSNGVSWHKEPFDVICKIRGKEARLRNLAFRTVGQAVAGTYWNLPPTQLRAGIGGEGFLAARTKPSLLQGSISPSCQRSSPRVRYSSTVLQPDVSPPTWTSLSPATKSPNILLTLEEHWPKALCSDLASHVHVLHVRFGWLLRNVFFLIMYLVIMWPVSPQTTD